MKKTLTIKTLTIKALTFLSIISLSHYKEIKNETKNYECCYFNQFDLIDNAIEGIQKALNNNSSQKPYFIRRTYNICKNEISITTKAHYRQYRKKPTYFKEVLKAQNNENINTTIEFVYKPNIDPDHIIQINKKNKKKGLFKTKKIAFRINNIIKA